MFLDVQPSLIYDPRRATTRILLDIDEWLLVQSLVEPRPRGASQGRWRFCLEAWQGMLDPRLGSYERVAEQAALTRGPRYWTPSRVKVACMQAVLAVYDRAHRRNIIIVESSG